jgi:O-antigen ligase
MTRLDSHIRGRSAFVFPGSQSQTARLLVAITAISLGLGASASAAAASHRLDYVVGSTLGIALLVCLFAISIDTLPKITLLVTLLVPTDIGQLPAALQSFPVGIFPLTIWLIRARSSRTPPILRLLAILLLVLLLLSEALAPLHTRRGWIWLATAIISLPFAMLSAPGGLSAHRFRALFLSITSLLALYGVVEGFVLHTNLLFGWLFAHTSWWARLKYDASYRVTTLLGHPLINGAVFAVAATLGAADLLDRRDRPWYTYARLALFLGAVLATHSRGAAISAAIGIAVVLFLGGSRSSFIKGRRFVLAVSAIVAGAVIVTGLQARDESRQGRESAAVRVTVLDRAANTLHSLPFSGAGPGQSDAFRSARQMPGSEIPLEDSYAELAVSLGLVGVALFIMMTVAPVAIGLRRRHTLGEAAALLALLVDIGGFNAIESHPAILILIALLSICILASQEPPLSQSYLVSIPSAHR